MEQRSERVIIETDHYRMTGLITLPRDGYRSRLSDFLASAERDFIPLTDVLIEPLASPENRSRREFVVVSRSHIVFATPAEPSGGSSTL